MKPFIITNLEPIDKIKPDDFLILSSSYEDRCISLAQKTKYYNAKNIFINVYLNRHRKRDNNLKELHRVLEKKGKIQNINAETNNPLAGVNRMLYYIKSLSKSNDPTISLDISCFTRKHLLQLLNCLDTNNYLQRTKFYYSQPLNYPIEFQKPHAIGIDSISEIETLNGENLSSKDTLLILFLNFEGKRALALWQELQPHVTIPIIPYPSIKPEWDNSIQSQNKLLLSTLNYGTNTVEKISPIDPNETKEILLNITKGNYSNEIIKHNNYNYIIGALGTKPQILGIYKFWRISPFTTSIVYPAPIKYIPNDNFVSETENIWCIDSSQNW